jgi:adenine phosphoribosyltransferase
MGAVVEVETLAITTGKRRTLYLEEKDRQRCEGMHVALVEDVVTTGSNAQGMRSVMDRVGATVIAEIAVFTEGSPDRWPDVISLGHLPLMTRTPG